MKASYRYVVSAIFLVGFFLIGLVGTSTSMTFVWPAYFILGIAGTLSLGLLFLPVSFSLPRWLVFSILALTAYLLVRAIDSPVTYFAREDVALIVACFLVYAGFISICSSGSCRRALVIGIAGLVLFNLGFALLQVFFSPSLWLIPGYERSGSDRIGGLFNQADHFGIFLSALVPLWLALILFGRTRRLQTWCYSVLALGSVAAVLVSGSIPGVLVLVVGILALAILSLFTLWTKLRSQVRRAGVIAVSVAAAIAVGSVYFASDAVGRKLGHGMLLDSGASALPLVWEAGLKQASQSPWIGTGSRSSYIFTRSFRPPELSPEVGEPEFLHNEYLQMIADYGVVGLALLLLVLGLHFQNGIGFVGRYRNFAPAPGQVIPRSDHLALVVGALASLLALCGAATFDFAMHLPVFAVVASLLLACLAAPDPMAGALKQPTEPAVLPGGSLMFAVRSVAFGFGFALMAFGAIFMKSEYHFEMARLGFEGDPRHFKQFRHLQSARSIDPLNPFALSLSAHAQVAAISPEMVPLARAEALEKADLYFSQARRLYPQDIFAAIGHAAVLDELGRRSRARQRLSEAREWAPSYGNLLLAEAEHFLRHGQVVEAENAYRQALSVNAFRDEGAATEGLRTISEWKLIAEQNGFQWETEPSVPSPGENTLERIVPDASIEEKSVAGGIPDVPELAQ